MPCPVCQSLCCEHNEVAGKEAALTIAERLTLIQLTGAGKSTADPPREEILSARKRQMQIASELENHRKLAHSA